MSKEQVHIIECPFCGLKHSITTNKGETLLNHPDKILALQCADSFSDAGCKKIIVIMSQETYNITRK